MNDQKETEKNSPDVVDVTALTEELVQVLLRGLVRQVSDCKYNFFKKNPHHSSKHTYSLQSPKIC